MTQRAASITDSLSGLGTQSFTTSYTYDAYGRPQGTTHLQGAHAPVVIASGYTLGGSSTRFVYQIIGSDTAYWTARRARAWTR